ncbi:DUF1365 family protein [Streptomyces sp. V2I9]|nr:DUF1365 family protein [Streptomyces sp. V2I9]
MNALYPCTITHVRNRPTAYAFRHRTYLWLIDPDRPPRPPRALRPLARFEPRDHFGGTAPTIRAGLERFLRARGVELGDGTVTMLTQARVFGHVSTRSPSTGATAPTAAPSASSPRCTTRTAGATATCSTPTGTAGR